MVSGKANATVEALHFRFAVLLAVRRFAGGALAGAVALPAFGTVSQSCSSGW
jgi:hypothetical protein